MRRGFEPHRPHHLAFSLARRSFLHLRPFSDEADCRPASSSERHARGPCDNSRDLRGSPERWRKHGYLSISDSRHDRGASDSASPAHHGSHVRRSPAMRHIPSYHWMTCYHSLVRCVAEGRLCLLIVLPDPAFHCLADVPGRHPEGTRPDEQQGGLSRSPQTGRTTPPGTGS